MSDSSNRDATRAPVAASALTVALCAAFASAPASADLVIQPIGVLLGQYGLDLNGDNVDEYFFERVEQFDTGSSDLVFFQNQVNTFANEVAIDPNKGSPFVEAIGSNQSIDASRMWEQQSQGVLSGAIRISDFKTIPFGNFFGVPLAYVGLRFELPDGIHYGWVEVTDPPGDITLIRAAFDDIPGVFVQTPGAVPEPGSLALLIAGAAGVLAMRRRQRAS